jgi:hypothetical protein
MLKRGCRKALLFGGLIILITHVLLQCISTNLELNKLTKTVAVLLLRAVLEADHHGMSLGALPRTTLPVCYCGLRPCSDCCLPPVVQQRAAQDPAEVEEGHEVGYEEGHRDLQQEEEGKP